MIFVASSSGISELPKLENPSDELDYKSLFSNHMRRLKESVYQEQQHSVAKIIHAFLRLCDGERTGLEERDIKHALTLKENLSKFGYTQQSARCAMAFLARADEVVIPKKNLT